MKKIVIPVSIVFVVVICIVLVLANNKAKINKASKPVDRTSIPVSVTVGRAAVAPLDVNVNYPAFIKPFDEAGVFSQTNGMIAWLNLELGQQVRKGQLIGRLDTRILELNLKTAGVSLQSEAINKAKLLADYNRAKDLYENKAGLEVNMLTAKNNYDNAVSQYDNAALQITLIRQQIANACILSPLDGIVSAKKVKQGEFVTSGSPIATITNIHTLKVTVFADQRISYQLKTGQTGIITSSIFGDKQFSGKIIYISPVADDNHNYQVDLVVVNEKDISLKAGTDVLVSFNTLTKREALQIPKSAVVSDARDPYVYVVENGKAKSRIIKTGIIQNDKAEVLSGLKAGEIVVVNGQINLSDSSNISIIN